MCWNCDMKIPLGANLQDLTRFAPDLPLAGPLSEDLSPPPSQAGPQKAAEWRPFLVYFCNRQTSPVLFSSHLFAETFLRGIPHRQALR